MQLIVNIALCLSLTSAIVTSVAQARGVITATVIDQNGAPVAGATVQVLPDSRKIQSDIIRECLTNQDGVCSQNLIFGRYHVTAMRKVDGYPNLTFNFYGHGKWPATVTITPARPKAHVKIQLGPRAARLALTIVDAVTGHPIRNASITLHPAVDKRDFLLTNLGVDSAILIPPNEDVLVEISANGYKPWRMTTQPGARYANSVRLKSGETRN